MRIRMHPANPEWPARFAQVKARLQPALPADALIHHIGSTAVPGLIAKDIIDIQVTLPSLTDLHAEALLLPGFTRRLAICDHQPPGMTLPDDELTKHLFACTVPDANVHIRAQGRFNQRYPLLCRDYLRAHPLETEAYAAIKHHLALRFPGDMQAYYDIKDPVFDLIMSAAEPWAAATNWTLPPPD